MRILDLFAGLGGWSRPWREAGHVVCTLEWQSRFAPDICADVLEADIPDRIAQVLGGMPDVILASPPCEGFSVARIGTNWHREGDGVGAPKTPKAEMAMRLVARTLDLVEYLEPRFWVMENPMGALRALPLVAHLQRRTVTYCQLGETYMKPTDLWSDRWPPSLVLPEPCRTNRNDPTVEVDGKTFRVNRTSGLPCHEKAERGAKTGTQGLPGAAERSLIPAQLARLFMDACLADRGDLPAASAPIRREPLGALTLF